MLIPASCLSLRFPLQQAPAHAAAYAVVAALLLCLPAELTRLAAGSAAAAAPAPVAVSHHLSATAKRHQTTGVYACLQMWYIHIAAAPPVAVSGHLSATAKRHQTSGMYVCLQICYIHTATAAGFAAAAAPVAVSHDLSATSKQH